MAAPAPGRQFFLDALRGLALVFMVVNHTAHAWLDRSGGWPRYHIVYLTVTLAAPLFLFLVGFCLPLSYRAAVGRGVSFGRIALRYARRGAGLVVAGWALTLLVFPTEPLFEGGVLQTIGLAIVLLTPVMPLLRWRAGRLGAGLAALALYASFALRHGALRSWLAGHPVVTEVWFTDFPLWPWFAIVLLGGALGWSWTTRSRVPDAALRYLTRMGAAGVACLAAFLALELTVGTYPHLASQRDLVLNHHWNPGPVTTLWILGVVFVALPAFYYLVELRGVRLPWLVVMGQHAFVLYFAHQIVVFTIVSEWQGVVLHAWWLYALGNVLLLAGCVGFAYAWPEFTRRAWALGRSRAATRAASAGL